VPIGRLVGINFCVRYFLAAAEQDFVADSVEIKRDLY